MQIDCHAQQTIPCSAQAVFDLMVDSKRFPATFTGYGPIPAIRSIEIAGPLTNGTLRRIHNADGSILIEQVTTIEPPIRHAYTLTGFSLPFSMLVTRGDADWSVAESAAKSKVEWRYTFTLTTPLVYPLCAFVIGFFMRRAMQRCLDNMARVLVAGRLETPLAQ
jgi:hypothetical protein